MDEQSADAVNDQHKKMRDLLSEHQAIIGDNADDLKAKKTAHYWANPELQNMFSQLNYGPRPDK